MGFFDSLFGIGDANPANQARKYIDQIPGQLYGIYDPYIDRGNAQYAGLNQQYTNMGQDPTGYLNKILQSYTPSKAYQLQRDEALRAAGNTAAAGGMRGSLDDIQKQARIADSLSGQDMQQWLNNVLGIQSTGLTGQQGFYNQGYNAANNLAGDLSNVLGTQGQLAFQGQAQQNQSYRDLMNALFKHLATGASMAGSAMSGAGGGMSGAFM